jgi:hypothetical protein
MEGYVPVATFASELDAQVAQATLAAAEIDSALSLEDVGQMLPVFQQIRGVKLLVTPENLDEATRLLNEPTVEPPEEPGVA